MEAVDPQALGLLTTSAGVAFAMVWLASRLNALDVRKPERCPACGVLRRRNTCSCAR